MNVLYGIGFVITVVLGLFYQDKIFAQSRKKSFEENFVEILIIWLGSFVWVVALPMGVLAYFKEKNG